MTVADMEAVREQLGRRFPGEEINPAVVECLCEMYGHMIRLGSLAYLQGKARKPFLEDAPTWLAIDWEGIRVWFVWRRRRVYWSPGARTEAQRRTLRRAKRYFRCILGAVRACYDQGRAGEALSLPFPVMEVEEE